MNLAMARGELHGRGANTWAICLDCDRKKGRSLGGAWGGLGLWLVGWLYFTDNL
jgi:hypothetical protein